MPHSLLLTSLVALLFSSSAYAYLGPGLGAGTIGVILGLLGSILLALFAFFWYPLKRALFGKNSVDKDQDRDGDEQALGPEQAEEKPTDG